MMNLKFIKRGIFLLVLFSCLALFVYVSSVSAAEPYTVGMVGNLSERLYSGKANVMWIGDSISVQSLPYRYQKGVLETWNPARWRGLYFPWGSPAGSGTRVTTDSFSSNETSIAPGGIYPDGTSGWNIQDASYYNFSSDLTGFTGFVGSNGLDNTKFSSWAQDWSNNTNLTLRFLYVSSSNSTYLSYKAILRNGTQINIIDPAYFNDTVQGIYYKEINISASTGSGFDVAGGHSTRAANETILKYFFPLGYRMFNPDITTGLQWGPNTGSASWTTVCHIQGCNLSSVFAGRNYTDNYTDYSIRQYINYTDSNIFFIHISNMDSNEANNTNFVNSNYTNNIVSIINRYLLAYYSVKPNTQSSDRPYFIFLSAPDRSNSDMARTMTEAALETLVRNQSTYPNIAANTTLGLIKLRTQLNDTLGAWSSWQATYTDDGVHQNSAGSTLWANRTWIEIMNARTAVNGSINNWNFTLESKTVTNSTLSFNSGLFNNTDIYPQGLNITNASDILLYASNGTVYCRNVSSCDGSINVTISNYSLIYALNSYNFTENVARNSSPLWITANTSTYRYIASNLSGAINTTLIFNISNVDSISTITYTPAGSSPSKTYTSSEFNVTGTLLTLIASIDGGGGNNQFLFNPVVVAASSSTSSSSSGQGGSNYYLNSFELPTTLEDNVNPSSFTPGKSFKIRVNIYNLYNHTADADSVAINFTNYPTFSYSLLERVAPGIYEKSFVSGSDAPEFLVYSVIAKRGQIVLSKEYSMSLQKSEVKEETQEVISEDQLSLLDKILRFSKTNRFLLASLFVGASILVILILREFVFSRKLVHYHKRKR